MVSLRSPPPLLLLPLLLSLVLVVDRAAGTSNTSCPAAFLNRCSCGNAYSVYDGAQRMKYTVNCTNAGFRNASMLQHLPNQTEVLIFTGNSIPSLPINVFSRAQYYDYLHTIDLSNNHIRFIPGRTFHKVYNVKILILNHNDLDITYKNERPRLFSNFEVLERLHLTNAFAETVNASDYLLSLEDIFYESQLDSLKFLHLEQNEIWSIGSNTKVFCKLPQLQQVLLTDNRLTDFDFRIDCLPNLRHINLERNMITRLSDGAMSRLDAFTTTNSPVTLRLQQNIFVCDCRSKHFLSWLNTTQVDVTAWQDFRCTDGYPSQNIGKMFKEIEELQCPSSHAITPTISATKESAVARTIEITGYSSSTIATMSFFLVFTSSLLLAVTYFHCHKLKSLAVPYWQFVTRKIGYTGLDHEEAPQEVSV